MLLGEVGAGHVEFAYTSAVFLSNLKSSFKAPRKPQGTKIPSEIYCVSLTRSKEDISREMSSLFSTKYHDAISKINFEDLSKEYFRYSSLPSAWIGGEIESIDQLKSASQKSLPEMLMTTLNSHTPNNLVILDSLTDLIKSDSMTWPDLIFFLKGVQRMSKVWGGLIYALLSAGLVEEYKQEEIADCADGVLMFQWEDVGPTERRRTMQIIKFRGLLPQLEEDNVTKFETKFTATTGFEATKVKMIMGRR